MEVLLRHDVEKLGVTGDVVKVRVGFARNFLFPRGLACGVTDDNRRRVVVERTKRVERAAAKTAHLQELADALEGYALTIETRANKDGTLYGSVGPAEVAAALKRDGKAVAVGSIAMAEPVKQLGVSEVAVRLGEDAVAHLRLWVVEQKGGR